MGSESIAHEAEGRMGYWLRGHDDGATGLLSERFENLEQVSDGVTLQVLSCVRNWP